MFGWVKSLIVLVLLGSSLLAFSPYRYLTDKGYHYQFSHWDKENYRKGFQIELKPYSRLFKIKALTYFFTHAPVMGVNGLLLSKKDEKFFKKVVEFYESKYPVPAKPEILPATNQNSSRLLPKIKLKNLPEREVGFDRDATKPRINYIFLDPGHGGKDPGAIFYGYQEKQVTLSVSLELREILIRRLKGSNTRIVMTRTKDQYVSLEKRCQSANYLLKQDENGLFISIHLNIWINPKSRGFEIYYLSHDDEINQERVYTHLEDIGASQVDYFKKIFSYLEVVQYQRESYFLSNLVTDLMKKRLKDYPTRENFKSDIFYVLRGVLMPSVLLELGFLSSREDMEFLNQEEKRTQMLETIAEAILIYAKDFNQSDGFKEGLFLDKLGNRS